MNEKITKKIKKADLSITVILLIGILIVVNFFSYQIFHRWDLTDGKEFSISKASKKTVSELSDVVTVKAYFSENLPSQFIGARQEVKDILDEYQAFSNGKLRVEFIDPANDEALKRELMTIGIPQLTFEVYEKDKTQLVNGYMGIAISFGDKVEAIPAVKQSTGDLEYQLTTAIKKITADQIATIGFLTSHGTADLESALKLASTELAEIYTISNVKLAEENPKIPENINTLIIVGPKENFNEDQFKAINKFAAHGGSLLVLFDGVNIGQGLAASENQSNLPELLKKYGVTVNKDLVADTRSGMASFSQGFFTFSSNYSFWPKVTNEGFANDHSAVSSLSNVIFPWASSINIDAGKIDEGEYKALAFTTPKAWLVKSNFDVTPNNANTAKGTQDEYTIAVAVNGLLTNAYPEGKEDAPDKFSGRLVVVGDSDFVNDNFVRNTPDNLVMFQNLVDSLSLDEDLINIRSKGVSSRPIKELSDSGRVAIRYFNIFGITFVVIVFGLVRYYLRRKSRFADDL